MTQEKDRGSNKILSAWKNRVLTDASVQEIVDVLKQSPAMVEGAIVSGSSGSSGLRVHLSYSGDDVPRCGNDLQFWLRWHLKFGGVVRPPKIIIKGIPFPDLVRMELDFGRVVDIPGVSTGVSPVSGIFDAT